MCGILLTINIENSQSRLKEALNFLNHRGPNDTGFLSRSWFSAGFKRLAILDLSEKGHQPMSNGKELHILHNGEVYNFSDIRKDLIKEGHSFISETDTEVVLKAFAEWGPSCVENFAGMFATVVIDEKNEKIHLFRDQLGVKPLYYYIEGRQVVIASEPKCIRQFFRFEVDEEILEEFLVYRSIVGRKTLVKKLFCVLPGEHVCIERDGNISRNIYGKTAERTPVPDKYEDIIEWTEQLLKESISYQLISDVPVGLQLSGGVDSSLIAAIIQTHFSRQKLNSFSITFDEGDFDESPYQKVVAERYGITHHEIPFNEQDFCGLLDKASWHNDFPIVQANSVAIMKLAAYAKNYVTVILSGEGADEAFWGYPKFKLLCNRKWVELLLRFSALQKIIPPVWKFNSALKLVKERGSFLEVFLKQQQIKFQNNIWLNETPYKKRYKYISGLDKDLEFSIPCYDQASSLQILLERFDRMTMSVSIEGRVPFCDHRLVRFANSIPMGHKAEASNLKKILKKIGEKYLPYDLLYRKKMGFSLPLNKWLQNGKGFGQYKDLLNDSEFRDKGLIDNSILNGLLVQRSYTMQESEDIMWPLISYELWHRQFIKHEQLV